MSEPVSDQQVIAAMRVYGGSFIKALAEAAAHADEVNLKRLRIAFPDYWVTYGSDDIQAAMKRRT